jgi:hypothetical protein
MLLGCGKCIYYRHAHATSQRGGGGGSNSRSQRQRNLGEISLRNVFYVVEKSL